jgi:non-heme chloroperoxidase
MTVATTEQTITEREAAQVERANASSATPVVFVHGLWLLPSSWDNWVALFEEAGYVGLTPDWPDDPETVEGARAEPEVLAKKSLKQVADHTIEIIRALDKKPALIGHSTGGLLAQMLAGRGLSAVTVAIDPGVFRGVLPLPASVLKGVGPFLVDPRTRGRAITLTFEQFKYGWANALEEQEARELYDRFHVAGSGISLAQMGNANLNPWTEAKVNTTNPDRGPLLIIDGERGLQEAEAQSGRDRDREDAEPRPLAHDRPRLARGRPDVARLRQEVHLAGRSFRDAVLRQGVAKRRSFATKSA